MEIAIIIIALIISAFFSGSETIFISASKVKLEILSRKKTLAARAVKVLTARPELFIITTLLGNNITNVTYSSVFAIFLEHHFSKITVIIISSSIVLIIGEIIPKAIGWEFSNQLVSKVALPLRFFQYIFSPMIWVLNYISTRLLSIFKIENNKGLTYLTRKDVQAIIHESGKAGVFKKEEHEIISRILELNETILKETMVPRTEIVALDYHSSLDEIMNSFQESGLSRLPVYEKEIDNIIGVIYVKDFFHCPEKIEDVIQEIHLVPQTKRAFSQLQEFRKKKTTIAIVIDEYGGTAGLVTFEDIVEELFGEIYDEFDLDHEHLFKKLNKFTFLVKGRAEIDELNLKFNIRIPEGDYTTLAGFITAKLGKIPRSGEVVRLDKCRLIVTKSTRKKVSEVKIIKRELKSGSK